MFKRTLFCLFLLISFAIATAQKNATKPEFNVIAFYTAQNDQAHLSFVAEANHWFSKMANEYHFQYEPTKDWTKLNPDSLSKYQVVVFLDTRPETPEQRNAFEKYMENGGAWMGFHFAAFALNNSDFPQNWDWYHNIFLGSGQYVSNTWRPTSAVLRFENQSAAFKNLPAKFSSAPNEWYRWQNDLRKNPDIEIILAIDASSFPLGTGPKAHEIWDTGYYPVVWRNKKFNMLYLNMGHNDIDYERGTNKTLSHTFANTHQAKLILDGLLGLGKKAKR